jgi:hypothetical protein
MSSPDYEAPDAPVAVNPVDRVRAPASGRSCPSHAGSRARRPPSLADPARGLADADLSLGRRVLRLDHFLLRAERLTFACSVFALDQLLLLGSTAGPAADPRAAAAALRVSASRARSSRLAASAGGLPVELVDLPLHARVP